MDRDRVDEDILRTVNSQARQGCKMVIGLCSPDELHGVFEEHIQKVLRGGERTVLVKEEKQHTTDVWQVL